MSSLQHQVDSTHSMNDPLSSPRMCNAIAGHAGSVKHVFFLVKRWGPPLGYGAQVLDQIVTAARITKLTAAIMPMYRALVMIRQHQVCSYSW